MQHAAGFISLFFLEVPKWAGSGLVPAFKRSRGLKPCCALLTGLGLGGGPILLAYVHVVGERAAIQREILIPAHAGCAEPGNTHDDV
jgi:hypothetical protein